MKSHPIRHKKSRITRREKKSYALRKTANPVIRRKGIQHRGKKHARLLFSSQKLLKQQSPKRSKKSLKKRGKKNISRPSSLAKHHENPIIAPRQNNAWEAYQTFNPAALYEDGNVHILYRALGHDGISRLGYAKSDDGVTINERLDNPVYTAPAGHNRYQTSPIIYSSGGGWGGCEDPRLVKIDDRVYLMFVAFDGWGSVQMALSWITLNDFLNQQWKWKTPLLISPPGEIHKNWVLFPEKIKGKYAILHSMSPHILIDYFDSLDDFDTRDGRTYYIRSYYAKDPVKKRWDSWVRGAGPPPIKTPYGWLLLYHAMDALNPYRYQLGAMILDTEDPTNILYRSPSPILEPDEAYENQGHKAGVVYSCGAVIKDGQLFIYYGGADTVVCVATAHLETFLKDLMRSQRPRIKRVK